MSLGIKIFLEQWNQLHIALIYTLLDIVMRTRLSNFGTSSQILTERPAKRDPFSLVKGKDIC